MNTPKPPTDNFPRVYRGGSWSDSSATFVRAAWRVVSTPTDRSDDVGFRCAQRGVRQPLKVQP